MSRQMIEEVVGCVPRRAMFYLPAHSDNLFQLANSIKVDSVIFDLEDCVPLAEKQKAREQVIAYLNCREKPDNSHCYLDLSVRLNSISSDLLSQDLQALSKAKNQPDTYIVPKMESADEALLVWNLICEAVDFNAMPTPTKLLIMIETPKGLFNMNAIISQLLELNSNKFVFEGAMFGNKDFCQSIGAELSNGGEESSYARQHFMCSCKAFGLVAIDGVPADGIPLESLKERVAQDNSWGFNGKQCLKQCDIPVIQGGFTPTRDTIEWALSVMEQYEQHNGGVFFYRNKVVDHPCSN